MPAAAHPPPCLLLYRQPSLSLVTCIRSIWSGEPDSAYIHPSEMRRANTQFKRDVQMLRNNCRCRKRITQRVWSCTAGMQQKNSGLTSTVSISLSNDLFRLSFIWITLIYGIAALYDYNSVIFQTTSFAQIQTPLPTPCVAAFHRDSSVQSSASQ